MRISTYISLICTLHFHRSNIGCRPSASGRRWSDRRYAAQQKALLDRQADCDGPREVLFSAVFMPIPAISFQRICYTVEKQVAGRVEHSHHQSKSSRHFEAAPLLSEVSRNSILITKHSLSERFFIFENICKCQRQTPFQIHAKLIVT